jgi:DNA-binding GntR family transcriptional regulator
MIINQKSLREQVYDFIRGELSNGRLLPGDAINLNVLSHELNISKTPLRDALLQLDTEGFVTISPRRGVFVNRLTAEDIRNCYEVIGALESAAILSVFDRFGPAHIEKMKWLNAALRSALKNEDYQTYYQQNLLFHDVFLELSRNDPLKRIIAPMKQRLYDFPRRGYIREWELGNCRDHERLIESIEKQDPAAAVQLWRDVHWSFTAQEKHIRRFYFGEEPGKGAPAPSRIKDRRKAPRSGRTNQRILAQKTGRS